MSRVTVDKVPTSRDRSLPIFSEMDEFANRVRRRAYELFTDRIAGASHDFHDWLTAEREFSWPAAELIERDEAFELKVALAGFDARDITVTATPKELLVKATHQSADEKAGGKEAMHVHWSEFRFNDFFRRVELPKDIDAKKVTAELKNGLLTITAPKPGQKKARKAARKKKTKAAKKKTAKAAPKRRTD